MPEICGPNLARLTRLLLKVVVPWPARSSRLLVTKRTESANSRGIR